LIYSPVQHKIFHILLEAIQMAGKALKKQILSDVAEKGGADWLFDQIASGMTIAKMAEQYKCTRSYISRTLNANPEYKRALEQARVEAADALVEEGLDMVDKLSGKSSASEIAATREKINWRKFMAGSMNQNKYGTRPQTNVTLSIGDLHLDALRKINAERKAIEEEDRAREQAIEGDYEVRDE
jgi:AraC-like DNA-binding protein